MRIPKDLQGEARKFFKRNAKRLVELDVLLDSDIDGFVLLCKVWAKLIEAENNNLDAIKFVALSKQCQNLMKSYGLTPESRKRLKVKEKEEPSVDEFGL